MSAKFQTPVVVGSSEVIRDGTDVRVFVDCETVSRKTTPSSRIRRSLNGAVGLA
jgi:hypothetical protein